MSPAGASAPGEPLVPFLIPPATALYPQRVATADAAFRTAANEQATRDRGVARAALPERRRVSAARRAHQRHRSFKRARRWRRGCEKRISTLKRRHGLKRCRYRGLQGTERRVGWAVLANNLLVLGRSASPPKSGGEAIKKKRKIDQGYSSRRTPP